MKITRDMYNYICSFANNDSYEVGGILGSSRDEIITDIILDKPIDSKKCKCEYYPNVFFLNNEIEKWYQKNINFLGIFHTHFSGSRDLSCGDRKYIKEIMYSTKGIVDCMYFPIFTLPDQVITAYKAFFEKDELVIIKDELEEVLI